MFVVGRIDSPWGRRVGRCRAVLCVALASATASQGAQAPVAHDGLPLPEAPEKAVLIRHCVACHGIERVQQSGGGEAIWDDRIRRMLRWGATIPQEHIGPLSRYLASALPRRLRPPPRQSWFAGTTVSEVAVQRLQTTLRLAGSYDALRRALVVPLSPWEASLVRTGQRARAFSVAARADMMPGRVSGTYTAAGRQSALVATDKAPHTVTPVCIVEIVVERGQSLAVANDALIEEGDRRFVYVRDPIGNFQRREIAVGPQADQYTAVRNGLAAGDAVVTLGSFFIDAEYRMSASTATPAMTDNLH